MIYLSGRCLQQRSYLDSKIIHLLTVDIEPDKVSEPESDTRGSRKFLYFQKVFSDITDRIDRLICWEQEVLLLKDRLIMESVVDLVRFLILFRLKSFHRE